MIMVEMEEANNEQLVFSKEQEDLMEEIVLDLNLDSETLNHMEEMQSPTSNTSNGKQFSKQLANQVESQSVQSFSDVGTVKKQEMEMNEDIFGFNQETAPKRQKITVKTDIPSHSSINTNFTQQEVNLNVNREDVNDISKETQKNEEKISKSNQKRNRPNQNNQSEG